MGVDLPQTGEGQESTQKILLSLKSLEEKAHTIIRDATFHEIHVLITQRICWLKLLNNLLQVGQDGETCSLRASAGFCDWPPPHINFKKQSVNDKELVWIFTCPMWLAAIFSLWTYVIVIPFYLFLEHPWASYAMMMKNLAQRPAQSSDSPRNLEMGVVGRSNAPSQGDQPWHIKKIKKDMQLHSELDLKGWPWRGASHVGPLPAMPGRNERSCWYDAVNSTFGCSKHLNDLLKHSINLIINYCKDNEEVLPYQLLGSTWQDLVR